jgi:recombination protein RecA
MKVNKAKEVKLSRSDLMQRIGALCEQADKLLPSRNCDNTLTYLGKKDVTKIPTFSSGSWALDAALGGGYPRGRFIEIFGPEGGGKTTLALHAIAVTQRLDPNALVAFIDAENSLDLFYSKALGVNVETLMVSQPDSGEQAMNIAKFLIENGAKLIVIDSAAALTPEIQLEKAIGEATVGAHAKLMSEGIRVLNSLLRVYGTTIIFTNQLRCMIGQTMGSGFTTPGGRALRFYASQRVEVKRTGSDAHGDQAINNIVVAKVVKNKIAPPFLKAQFKITFGKGIDPVEQLIDYGIKYGFIEKSGAWFVLNGQKFQGHKQLYGCLTENKEVSTKLESKIVEKLSQNGQLLELSTQLQDIKPADVSVVSPEPNAEIPVVDVVEMMKTETNELEDQDGGEE